MNFWKKFFFHWNCAYHRTPPDSIFGANAMWFFAFLKNAKVSTNFIRLLLLQNRQEVPHRRELWYLKAANLLDLTFFSFKTLYSHPNLHEKYILWETVELHRKSPGRPFWLLMHVSCIFRLVFNENTMFWKKKKWNLANLPTSNIITLSDEAIPDDFEGVEADWNLY